MFDRLWQDARAGDEQRLCASGRRRRAEHAPSCIDWAALSAIAGDHSCSSREMFETARSAPWILQVADVAAQLKVDLGRIPVTAGPEPAGGRHGRDDRRAAPHRERDARGHGASTRCAPPTSGCSAPTRDYATRAGSNNAHFLLARPDTDDRPDATMPR